LHRPSVDHPLFFLGVQIIHDVHEEANAANRNESDEDDRDNRIAIIVGTFGEMKGAVQCAQSI